MKYNHNELDKETVLAMWQNIEQYYDISKRKRYSRVLNKSNRYLAVLLLVALGTAAFWYFGGFKHRFRFESGDSIIKNGVAKLICSGGEEINLGNGNSYIEIKGREAIFLNNEISIDLRNQQPTIYSETRMNEVIIPFGKESLIVLDDGSKVWLFAGSRLAFPTIFKGNKREVYLEGEAIFEVAKVPDQSFNVYAGECSINALGTIFYLSAFSSEEEIKTVLLKGSVVLNVHSAFRLSHNEVVLEPGQRAIFTRHDKRINVDKEDNVEFYSAWTDGWFLFSKERLFNIFKKLERYYNINIIYSEQFQSNDLISGKLDLKDSISDVMLALSNLSRIKYKIENGSINIENYPN